MCEKSACFRFFGAFGADFNSFFHDNVRISYRSSAAEDGTRLHGSGTGIGMSPVVDIPVLAPDPCWIENSHFKLGFSCRWSCHLHSSECVDIKLNLLQRYCTLWLFFFTFFFFFTLFFFFALFLVLSL